MKTILPQSNLAHRAPLSNLTKLFAGAVIAALILITALLIITFGARIASAGQPAHATYHQDIEPHPFGPGWAADYGTFSDSPTVATTARPFGPGWAADYGIPAH